jgi:hypothetical protein
MPNIRKVPASSGVQWLLDAFALFRKQPWRLGWLGLGWGMLSLLALQGTTLNPALGSALQVVLILLGPFLLAGVLWAIREVDEGRPALPVHLFHALQLGRARGLLTTLLPQAIAGLVLYAAFQALVGSAALQRFGEVAEQILAVQQAGGQPDPAWFAGLPVGGMMLCLLLAVALALAIALTVFTAVPRIIFGGASGLAALRDSLLASLRNLPAMAVHLLLMLMVTFALAFTGQLAAFILSVVFGPNVAILLVNLLLMAVLMPLVAGSAYFAWKQFSRDDGDASLAAVARIEV